MKRKRFLTIVRDLSAPVVKIIDKIIIEPARYGIGKHYNAEKYWRERFKRFGMTLRGSGNRQLTEEENEHFYRGATQSFLSILEQENIALHTCRILDVGCGTGYYTRFCKQQGVTRYTGLDVTDVLFPELQREFPDYTFIRHDLTREPITGEYDCVLMLDVMEHIVDGSALAGALKSILSALSDNGILILAPVMDTAVTRLSYVRYWTLEEIRPLLKGYRVSTSMPFPDGMIIGVRR
jgi:2-polyprenyl-3-methyl-5-hydroxy-6-metoxy-1,4-benzoquinol methylase